MKASQYLEGSLLHVTRSNRLLTASFLPFHQHSVDIADNSDDIADKSNKLNFIPEICALIVISLFLKPKLQQ